MKILKIQIITREHGTDLVNLFTDLPPCFPDCDQGAVLTFSVRRGHGKEYCEKNFPDVSIEVLPT